MRVGNRADVDEPRLIRMSILIALVLLGVAVWYFRAHSGDHA